MLIDHVTVGPFAENAYLLVDREAGVGVLVDPGDEPDAIVAMAARHRVAPSAIWLTHAHLDHIGAVQAIRRNWPGIPVHMHPADAPVFERGAMAAAAYGIPFEQPDPPDLPLAEGQRIAVGSHEFTVWHVPGHAPGHVVFIAEALMIGGDCLFAGSVGRTDFPGCDKEAFNRTLTRLMTLEDRCVVLPGHGPPTTIGAERASNPFLPPAVRRGSPIEA
ncbi:MAG: MBL fold metallo-hydrolase [Gemmatimonadetes bacterium]|nr:MBL fold metallo-hydrolase [Gemmatimonadota bacterium]